MNPPVIYLDTQDYSRFGDVLRGKSDSFTESIFISLENMVKNGDIIIAVSMPIFSELIQYDINFRETSFCKAQAIERLCGAWALAFPSRLIASEIGKAACEIGILHTANEIQILSSDRYWYPDISDVFSNLRSQMQAHIDQEMESLKHLPRKTRLRLKNVANRMKFSDIARQSTPEFAEKFGLPPEVFIKSIVALLEGRTTPSKASRTLFNAIAVPTVFVETYFERVESDRTLPAWMGNFGRDIQGKLITMVDALDPIFHIDYVQEKIEAMLSEWSEKLGTTAINLATGNEAELGIDADTLGRLAVDPRMIAAVPSAQVLSRIVPSYVRQIVGLSGSKGKVEASFGGDLIHAFYLPHVDLWRADRRFGTLVLNSMPNYASRIVPTLSDLPNAIQKWKSERLNQKHSSQF